jgi:hypothetical protein
MLGLSYAGVGCATFGGDRWRVEERHGDRQAELVAAVRRIPEVGETVLLELEIP